MSCGRGEYYPKRIRLRKRAEYLRVQRHGHKVQSSAFIGLVLKRDTGQTRLGITTSKRLGNAVIRNKTKRLIKEAFRRGQMQLPDHIDVVVIAKKKATELDSDAVSNALATLGSQVRRLVEQHS
ncbi:MAG: ribonuclease P protein component [Proteobacteria bacterium]|nr:ribonuclease P protein component [Pseudomonadota bacterium]